MRITLFSAAAALLSASLAAHADTSTFDFTYASTGGAIAGETAVGSGSFNVSYTLGKRTGTLSAFSFTDTINSSLGDSTFVYSGLGAVASSEFVLTLGGGGLPRALITTDSRFGTDTAFGAVSFSLQEIQNVVTASTFAQQPHAPDASAGNTTGSGSVTFVSAVAPEPSTFALLSTGLLGGAGVLKRRYQSVRRPR